MPDLPDQVRNLVSERTRATRDRAQKAARALLEQAGLDQVADTATERVGHLLEDILAASRTNRRMLENLVAVQIDETASRLGFARQSEVDALRKEIADLRVQVVPTPAKRAAARKAAGTRKGHTSPTSAAGDPASNSADPSAVPGSATGRSATAHTAQTTASEPGQSGQPGTTGAGQATLDV